MVSHGLLEGSAQADKAGGGHKKHDNEGAPIESESVVAHDTASFAGRNREKFKLGRTRASDNPAKCSAHAQL
jgi:hypothetical protein